MDKEKIIFVGLGKLGLSLAYILSTKFSVLGYDKNTAHVNNLKSNNYSSIENDVKKFVLKKKKLKIKFTHDLKKNDFNKIKSVFILIATNSSIYGNYDSKNLLILINSLIKKINKNVEASNKKILINICSTLQPGTYNKFLKPIENRNKNIRFTYVPEFVACGDTIEGFLNPDQLVVGANDKASKKKIINIYKKIIPKKKINNLTIEGAEMVKLSTNAYICNKISFANLIGEICEINKIKDIHEVLKTIGSDTRIGNKFFKSGPPFGGLCFPKDVRAFQNLCNQSKVNSQLIKSVETINLRKEQFLVKQLNTLIKKKNLKKIGIIGYTFKENTKVTLESQYEKILNKLNIKKIYVFDENIKFISIGKNFEKCLKLSSLIKKCNHIILFHKNKKYEKIALKNSKKNFFSVWETQAKNIIDLNSSGY